MPRRNEIYSFEKEDAMNIQKRQARVSMAKDCLWCLFWIALGVALGYVLTWAQK